MVKTKNYVRFVSSLAWVAVFAGCGSLSHKKDDQALSQVRKVAVVAFMVDEPAAAGIGLNLGSGKVEADAGGSPISKESDEVTQMLHALQKAFAKNMSWKITSTDEMAKSPVYIAAYKDTMEGFQNKMPPGQGKNRFLVNRVMDFDCARILGRSGRDKLIEALGVDAIIAAKVDVNLKGTSVMGIGARHPQSNLSFSVYKKGQDAPIWFEGQIKGVETKESVGSTQFTDEDATSRLALKSAQTAFDQIGKSVN